MQGRGFARTPGVCAYPQVGRHNVENQVSCVCRLQYQVCDLLYSSGQVHVAWRREKGSSGRRFLIFHRTGCVRHCFDVRGHLICDEPFRESPLIGLEVFQRAPQSEVVEHVAVD